MRKYVVFLIAVLLLLMSAVFVSAGWGSQDADGDGYSNAEEMWSGSDPYDHDDTPDTEGEGEGDDSDSSEGIIGDDTHRGPGPGAYGGLSAAKLKAIEMRLDRVEATVSNIKSAVVTLTGFLSGQGAGAGLAKAALASEINSLLSAGKSSGVKPPSAGLVKEGPAGSVQGKPKAGVVKVGYGYPGSAAKTAAKGSTSRGFFARLFNF